MEEKTPISKPKRVLKPKHHLPSDNLKVDGQLEVLRAYVAASDRGKKAVGYKEVAEFVDCYDTVVSSYNKFFEESGLILRQGKGKYVPHENVVEYTDMVQYDDEKALGYLRDILKDSWFGKVALKRLSVAESISEEALLKKLGGEVG